MGSVVRVDGGASVGPPLPALRATVGRWREWHPEWPAAVLAALAWVVLIGGAFVPSDEAVALHQHHLQHGMPTAAPAGPAGPGVLAQQPGWMVMSLAMMVPLALPGLNYVAHNSLRSRRGRAMALFLGAFVLPWLPFGIVAVAANGLVVDGLVVDGLGPDRRLVLAGTLALAAAWQLTRTKRRALLACTRTVPLPPGGRRADVACIRFGGVYAGRCLRSCWAVMLVMIPAGHGLAWMVAITALIVAEQRYPQAFTGRQAPGRGLLHSLTRWRRAGPWPGR